MWNVDNANKWVLIDSADRVSHRLHRLCSPASPNQIRYISSKCGGSRRQDMFHGTRRMVAQHKLLPNWHCASSLLTLIMMAHPTQRSGHPRGLVDYIAEKIQALNPSSLLWSAVRVVHLAVQVSISSRTAQDSKRGTALRRIRRACVAFDLLKSFPAREL